ncbi:single-stranded-DNA-specific exonuclease RecJ [Thioalkalivibrio sulfidiphilus]|uniref:single-stranded-DNA-specific exonuclease RecJ n=1 Tax=Thioalkalivibrio sulfidiphilus TaxID=1033854 RepID=UPI00035F88C0|nr:single-stranded-DNA-specific exonuclease RecJ [Thioalkalivibrio sulfidiphilus]
MKALRTIRRRQPPAGVALPQGDVLARVLALRGVLDPAQCDYGLKGLAAPHLLSGIESAVERLERALRSGERIVVVGDFDADGATSTAVALRALSALGARDVHFRVPNRFEYGYGLTPEIVSVLRPLDAGLLITVDNGVSSLDGVAAARHAGMSVLVTDHHLPGASLPAADALVNPNLPDDPFPSKHLAGVGVIFYVMLALRARLRDSGWFDTRGIDEPNLAELLDLVALGTVADVVPLDQNNRILVEQGLRRIRAGAAIPGIGAILEVARRTPERSVATDLGFAVGPRLNAAGRLDDMALGIRCLLTDDPVEARALAAALDDLNADRRDIEAQMQAEALAGLEALPVDSWGDRYGVCLYEPQWHQGVIGILAARIRERIHRPVIAFADAGDGQIKGSARSIPGLHIRDALDDVAARHPGLISKFGGHAMAAGLSLPLAHLQAFSEAFDQTVAARVSPEDLEGVVHSDGELSPGEISLDTAVRLRDAGPWGQGFPPPVFDGEFEILDRRVLKERHLRLQLRAAPGAPPITGIAFNVDWDDWPEGLCRVRLAYRLEVNEYQGLVSPQLMIEHVERC